MSVRFVGLVRLVSTSLWVVLAGVNCLGHNVVDRVRPLTHSLTHSLSFTVIARSLQCQGNRSRKLIYMIITRVTLQVVWQLGNLYGTLYHPSSQTSGKILHFLLNQLRWYRVTRWTSIYRYLLESSHRLKKRRSERNQKDPWKKIFIRSL